MDSWQKEIIDKLQSFVNKYPPSYIKESGGGGEIAIGNIEAYVLLNIAEQWIRYNSPTILIELSTDAKTDKTTD